MKRLKYVVGKPLNRPEIEYLYRYHCSPYAERRDMLFNFLLKSSVVESNVIEGTPLYPKWSPVYDTVDDTSVSGPSRGYESFEYLNEEDDVVEKYYIYHDKDNVILFKEIPLLMDDDMFKWKENSKYNATEAIVTMGAFEYQCIVNADGNGKVIVRYVKCENFHRTKVTIAEFDVEDAYNESFYAAIYKWNSEFKNSIAS